MLMSSRRWYIVCAKVALNVHDQYYAPLATLSNRVNHLSEEINSDIINRT